MLTVRQSKHGTIVRGTTHPIPRRQRPALREKTKTRSETYQDRPGDAWDSVIQEQFAAHENKQETFGLSAKDKLKASLQFSSSILDINPTFYTCQFLIDQVVFGQLWTGLIPQQSAQNPKPGLADLPTMHVPLKSSLRLQALGCSGHESPRLSGLKPSRVEYSSNKAMFIRIRS